MDDHLLGSLKEERCLHSRKILPVLDLKDRYRITKGLSKHISRCRICTEQLEITTTFLGEISKNIPVVNPKEDILENFQNEIHEIVKGIDIPSTNKYSKFFNLEYLGLAKSVFMDIYRVLISRKLILAYILSSLLIIIFKVA